MKWASVVSDQQTLERAMDECVSSIRQSLGEAPPDLAVAFVSPHFSGEYDYIPAMMKDKLGAKLLFGCSAGGVIGGGKEVEHRPGFSITAAHLPGVEMEPFHLQGDELPDMDASPDEWERVFHIPPEKDPKFLLLLDPFSFPAQNLIAGLDYAYGRSVKIGGLASGGQQHGGNALFLGGQSHRSGAIGIALHGNIAVDTIVAQGCRPVGQIMTISKCRQNLLLEVDDRPPLEVLRELYMSSNQRDQELMQNSLFLGVVMDDFVDQPRRGDFLVRNVIGLDARTGAMAIGELLREGQRVQFHLRDALTSAEDLSALLNRYTGETRDSQAQGALLFSCLGRGEYLYGRPDHDTEMFRDSIGVVPLGGFFCNGEIGQVGGTTFLHGYTSSFGIFRPDKE
jgi:small ligand-binding sensory domain FIST